MYVQPMRLLHESLQRSAEDAPGKTAIVAEGTPYSYRDLQERASAFAAALRQQGVRRGERVALYMDNTFACAAAIYGTLMADAVFMVINPQTKADKLTFILNDSEAVFLVTDAHLHGVASQALAGATYCRAVVVAGDQAERSLAASIPVLSFDALTAGAPRGAVRGAAIANDLAALIYTSGSTGQPKGVMMTHASMVFAAQSLIQYLRLAPDDRILNVLPFAFDYGLYQLLMSVFLGATLVLERSFTYAAQVINRMKEQAVTVFPGVPTIYATLVAMHRRNALEFPSVRRVTNTAAALPVDFQGPLHAMFPNALIYRMYGLTECKRVCYLEPELADIKPASVGKAMPGTETYLLAPDGRVCGPGDAGILHVRGPHVMKGYWKQPEQTARMLKPGPVPGEFVLCAQDWFKTDEDGDLYFLGRSDDIIKTRGEKVSPVEVENVLYGIAGVREAAVVGEAHETLGEAVVAYVALAPDAGLSPLDIRKHCMGKLENFMVPQRVVVLKSLPKTDNGKIKKTGLAELERAQNAGGV